MTPRLLHSEPVMPRGPVPPAAAAPHPRGEGRGEGARRLGFSLVELLVVVSIILLLIGMVAAAVSAARATQKRQATQSLIAKLDAIVQQQYASYASRSVPGIPPSGMTRGGYRSWYIRRNLMSGDLPDRWADVEYMSQGNGFPLTSPQRAYVGIFKSPGFAPTDQYAGAECLFMIVMQGGIADCLDCKDLVAADVGDKDGDGAQEFWDAWDNPIGFILWPAAIELPGGAGTRFFSGERTLQQAFPGPSSGQWPSPGLGMRPLIYSAGPDGEYGFERNDEARNLSAGTSPTGRDCGDWNKSPTSSSAGPLAGAADNITNFDAEAKK